MISNKIAYIIQTEIDIVETSKLVFRGWIAVGSKWNHASASSLIMIVDDAFRTGHIWIFETISKDHNISTGLQISNPIIDGHSSIDKDNIL